MDARGEDDDGMDEDRRERDAFVERLKERDEKRTKHVERKERDINVFKDARLSAEERAKLIPALRERSRQVYVKEREQIKVEELRREILDDHMMFDGQRDVLTERERQELALKERVLDLAEKRMEKIDDSERFRFVDSVDEEGVSTEDQRMKLLSARYDESRLNRSKGAEEKTEQQIWEETQLERLIEKKKERKVEVDEDHDLLLDSATRFVEEAVLAGASEADIFEEVKKEKEAKAKQSLADVRRSLPVYSYRTAFLDALKEHQVLVVVGETGSGKTTQLPQYLRESGYCKGGKRIGITQPRRVAAMSVAARVSEEVGTVLGHEVGYSIRFEDCTSPKTLIQYMTDGMLLREFLSEPDLRSYSVIMLDEAHERTLHTDILFGLLKDVARFRDDLKLIVSSATLDAEKFQKYFDYAPILTVPGRRFKVTINYTKAPEPDYLDAAVVTVLHIHTTMAPGDILVFLTGQEEIELAEEMLKARTRGLGKKISELIVLPIYANLPSDLQAKIFEPTPPGARKVVLATNIAETSLTIDGIVYVVDPGFVKQNSYNPRSGMESLIVTPISRASCDQRAGRAGRVGPGHCYRVFTKWSFEHELETNTIPEIQRTNLGTVVLMLKSLGIDDLLHFDFMDPPPAETLIRALEHIYALGALNDRGELTKLGRRMAEFPVDPMLAKSLLAGELYGCAKEVITIVSMLSVNATIFYVPKEKKVHAEAARDALSSPLGDHFLLLNTYTAWEEDGFRVQWCFENFVQHRAMKRARDIRDQLVQLCERVEVDPETSCGGPRNYQNVQKAITAGFFINAARLQKTGSFQTVKTRESVWIHPSSALAQKKEREVPPPPWVIFHELVLTSKEFMRYVMEVEPSWLREIAPHYYKDLDVRQEKRRMPRGHGKASTPRSHDF